MLRPLTSVNRRAITQACPCCMTLHLCSMATRKEIWDLVPNIARWCREARQQVQEAAHAMLVYCKIFSRPYLVLWAGDLDSVSIGIRLTMSWYGCIHNISCGPQNKTLTHNSKTGSTCSYLAKNRNARSFRSTQRVVILFWYDIIDWILDANW